MKVIVVGTDGSDTASEAVRQAVELAAMAGAHLHLVTGYAAGRGDHVGGNGAVGESATWRVDPTARAEAVLDRAAAAARVHGVQTTVHARRGDPAEALMAVADEQDADVIVVGNKGMTGHRRLLGSVANKVSHHAGRTVVIAKTS